MEKDKTQFFEVGHVRDAHGIRGEVFVRLFAGRADWLEQLESVRLRPRGAGPEQARTFQIERQRVHKDGIVFKLAGIHDRNAAEELKGLTFEIPELLLVAEPGEAPYLREVLGFQVKDEVLGLLGEVEGFSSNGPQDLLVLKRQGREILIPFIEPFIRSIDYEGRMIEMVLPEGLVES